MFAPSIQMNIKIIIIKEGVEPSLSIAVKYMHCIYFQLFDKVLAMEHSLYMFFSLTQHEAMELYIFYYLFDNMKQWSCIYSVI